MKLRSRIAAAAVLVSVFIPGNIMNSDYSRSFKMLAIEITASWSKDSSYARALYEKLMNDMFLSPAIFDDNHIVAYYGHPKSKIMGIVGRYPIPKLAELLKKEAGNYDLANFDRGIIPAFYLIYGTCQPGGEINIIDKKLLDSYIDYALKNGFLVYLDHQIGRYTVEQALDQLLPYLKYPNIHLALDPEWRTTRPMREIGSITAKEINSAQQRMRDYMLANKIGGKKQLVFHQFQSKMIRNIKDVRCTYDPVILVHATSGWGSPDSKMSTHSRNALASNIPNKGFKLWYFYSDKHGVHYDRPLMKPSQVLRLNPEPGLIIYQ